MYVAIRPAVFAGTLLLSQAVFAQTDCASGGGSCPPTAPLSPYNAPFTPATGTPALPFMTPPAAPQARITVVDAMPQPAATSRPTSPAVPTARLTLVRATAEDSAATAPTTTAEQSKTDAAKLAGAAPAPEEKETAIDPALQGLIGTWLAVARHGDGELSTVELQLDDRGWAKFTVPGPDGKPSTTRQRVELEDKELKLTGPDAELTLGKLIEFDNRQMVLARSGGQITFVRP